MSIGSVASVLPHLQKGSFKVASPTMFAYKLALSKSVSTINFASILALGLFVLGVM